MVVQRGELAAACRGRSSEEREEGGEVVWGREKIFASLVASLGEMVAAGLASLSGDAVFASLARGRRRA